MLLSLFSGAGGLDAGFEQAGFRIGLAYEQRQPAVKSYNCNLGDGTVARVANVRELTLETLDSDFGELFTPTGVIGGPPCQSFSRGNSRRGHADVRSELVREFVNIALRLHRRSPLDFIALENVPELKDADGGRLLGREIRRLRRAGFNTKKFLVNAVNFGVPQARQRLFVVAINKLRKGRKWATPHGPHPVRTVRDAIGHLPEPVTYAAVTAGAIDFVHPNHWCMTPRSAKFTNGTLYPGYRRGRSFKTLSWDEPSITVSYGHREVHVHPNCTRRLSVYEAMLLQGFPEKYVLSGSLSDQFSQVSEAVPPPLAKAIAITIRSVIEAAAHQASEAAPQDIRLLATSLG